MFNNSLIELGKRFKKLRLAKGWSQTTCARKLGYSNKTSVSKIELGVQGIKRSNVAHVAEVLGTTPEYLMGWKQPDGATELSPTDKQILAGLDLLTDDDKQILLRFIRSMKEERTK